MFIICSDAKAGKHKENGWPESAFGMSKVTVIAMTIVQQAHMDELGKEDIVINAVSLYTIVFISLLTNIIITKHFRCSF